MGLQDFLKKKEEKNNEGSSKKNDFRAKIVDVLQEIKGLNEEKFNELNKIFHAQYDKVNIQKKKLIGFYGHLVEELRRLKDAAGIQVIKTTKKIVNHSPIKEAVEAINQVEKAVEKKTNQFKKEVKKTVKEVQKEANKVAKEIKAEVKKVTDKASNAKKKVVKKTAAKAAVKKKAPSVKKAPAAKKKASKAPAKKSAVKKKTTKR